MSAIRHAVTPWGAARAHSRVPVSRIDARLVAPVVVTWTVAALGVVAVGNRGDNLDEAARRTITLWVVIALIGLAACSAVVLFARSRSRASRELGRIALLRRKPTLLVSTWLPHLTLGSALAAAVLANVLLSAPSRSAPEWTRGETIAVTATVTGSGALSGGSSGAADAESHGNPGSTVRFGIVATGFERRALRPTTDVHTALDSAAVPCLAFVRTEHLAHNEVPAIGSAIRLSGQLIGTDPGDPTACLLFADGPPGLISRAPPVLDWADGVRRSFRAVVADYPGDGGDLVPGLVVGDVSLVSERLDDAMKASGLSHLTAVSGANCSIIVAGIVLGGSFVGLGRRSRGVLALVVLVAFVLVVTPQPSVLRASVSSAIVLISLVWSRRQSGLGCLCLAVIVLILLDPWLSHSIGFALSVSATAGLLVLAGPLAALVGRVLPPWLALAIAVPLSAQVVCQPLVILLSPTLSPYSVPANLLAAPAAPVATVVGLIVCLVGTLCPPVAAVLGWLVWLPSWWIAFVATSVAGLPGVRVPWVAGIPGVILLVGLTAVALVAVLARKRTRLRRLSAAAVVIALVGGYGGVLVGSLGGVRNALPTNWTVAACDVGQGDAIVVRDHTSFALVDLGPEPEPLERCLNGLGVTRLDLVVLTHFDLDHVGGVEAVAERADTVLVGPHDRPGADRVVASFREGGAKIVVVSRGDSGVLGSTPWRVWWPPPQTALRGNEASVVVSFGGAVSAVLLGDLPESSQAGLLALESSGVGIPEAEPYAIVKFAHHGSADQSKLLYARVGASLALISVGAGNRYGHPRQSALDILASLGCAVARTDRSGLIVVAPDPTSPDRGPPRRLVVWTERRSRHRPDGLRTS